MLKVSSCIKCARSWAVDQHENTFKIEVFNTIGKRTWKLSLKYCLFKILSLKIFNLQLQYPTQITHRCTPTHKDIGPSLKGINYYGNYCHWHRQLQLFYHYSYTPRNTRTPWHLQIQFIIHFYPTSSNNYLKYTIFWK